MVLPTELFGRHVPWDESLSIGCMMGEILRSLDDLPPSALHGAVTIGNFDGVHIGHAAIVRRLTAMSRQVPGPAVVFTFDPHPLAILSPDDAPVPLMWPERKAALLHELGVDSVVFYPTDLELLRLAPESFFDRILRDALQARGVVEGVDFRFGRQRTGDVALLRSLCERHQMKLEIVPPVEHAGSVVSSSRVRTMIASGDIEAANELLVARYRICGVVVEGARRGRELGFPTANLDRIPNLIPQVGVYAGRAFLDGAVWQAAIHVGPNPTFGEDGVKVEVHLIDCHIDCYGAMLEVEFQSKIRDVVSFDSVEDLQQQLQHDVGAVRKAVGE